MQYTESFQRLAPTNPKAAQIFNYFDLRTTAGQILPLPYATKHPSPRPHLVIINFGSMKTFRLSAS